MSSGKTVERISKFSERHQPAAAEYQAAAGAMENQALEDCNEGAADSSILKNWHLMQFWDSLFHIHSPVWAT